MAYDRYYDKAYGSQDDESQIYSQQAQEAKAKTTLYDQYGQPKQGVDNPYAIGVPSVDKAPMPSPGGSTPAPSAGRPSFDGKNWSGYDRPLGTTGVFTGFDQNKMSNPSGYGDANTSKYAFARYASHYDPRDPDALAKITADMQRDGFPVNFDGKDKIDFGDGYGGIDVLRNWEAGKGGDAWAWQPGGGGYTAQPYNSAPTPGTATATPTQVTGSGGTGVQTGAPGPGWVQTKDGGWVPPDHPLATGSKTTGYESGGTKVGTYAGLYGAPNSSYTYSGQLANAQMPTYGGYNYQVQNAGLYQPGQISGYNAPDMGEVGQRSQDAVIAALTNPSMSAQGVSQLKESSKEQALSMADQLRNRTMQSAASRGVTAGGATGDMLGDIDTALADSVLSGNRAVDIQKMTQDRKDLLDALSASEAWKSGEGQRAYQTGEMNLRTQLAREEAAQEASRQGLQNRGLDIDLERLRGDDAFRAYQSQQDAAKFELDRDIEAEKLRALQSESGLDYYKADIDRLVQSETLRRLQEALGLQGELGRGELDLEGRRLGESSRQFDQNYDLALKQFAEQMRQFNRELGFDYAGLLQRGQQYTTDYLKDI